MPLAGDGMLVTAMNVAPEHEDDFNRWYDREHLEERVRIPGFIEARRYEALRARRKYFATYTTDSFDVLTGSAYRHALQNQTDWSLRSIRRQIDPLRILGRVKGSVGSGRGRMLGVVRVRPQSGTGESLEKTITNMLPELSRQERMTSAHLIQPDARLSIPIENGDPADPTHTDWVLLVEGTTVDAVESGMAATDPLGSQVISKEVYVLLWDLHKNEIRNEQV
jgi:hypothetical protein